MKPTDKITVEITLAELAKIYAIMGRSNGSHAGWTLYGEGYGLFGAIDGAWNDKLKDIIADGIINYHQIEKEWVDYIFKQETEQQKRIRELKETITKAQQQIEELENC